MSLVSPLSNGSSGRLLPLDVLSVLRLIHCGQDLHVRPTFPSSKCALPPQLINQGPSSISQGVLEISCPQALEGQQLLYVTKVTGLNNCTSNYTPNSQGLEVRTWSSWGGAMGLWDGERLPGVDWKWWGDTVWREGKDPYLLHLCSLP